MDIPLFRDSDPPMDFLTGLLSKANSWQPENLSPFGVICSSGNTRGSDPDRVGAIVRWLILGLDLRWPRT
jgi:hypothetical protein